MNRFLTTVTVYENADFKNVEKVLYYIVRGTELYGTLRAMRNLFGDAVNRMMISVKPISDIESKRYKVSIVKEHAALINRNMDVIAEAKLDISNITHLQFLTDLETNVRKLIGINYID